VPRVCEHILVVFCCSRYALAVTETRQFGANWCTGACIINFCWLGMMSVKNVRNAAVEGAATRPAGMSTTTTTTLTRVPLPVCKECIALLTLTRVVLCVGHAETSKHSRCHRRHRGIGLHGDGWCQHDVSQQIAGAYCETLELTLHTHTYTVVAVFIDRSSCVGCTVRRRRCVCVIACNGRRV
jgi:hypothetical protein